MNNSIQNFIEKIRYSDSRKQNKKILFLLTLFFTISYHFAFGLGTEIVLANNLTQSQIAHNIALNPSPIEQSCDNQALVKGVLKCKAKAVVEVLGTNYACTKDNKWLVKTEIKAGAKTFTLSEGQRQTIIMNGKENPVISSVPVPAKNTCQTSSKIISNNSKNIRDRKVILLTNGSNIPQNKGFQQRNSTVSYLQKYIDREKITLAPNEAIYLFEIGQNNPEKAGFDLQDNAVKVSLYQSA